MESLPRYVSKSAVTELVAISEAVPFIFSKDHFVRLGEHENNLISEYYFSKWTKWNRHQRKAFKGLLPSDLIDKIFIANFTKYAANTGFLDKIVQFRDRGQKTGMIVAVALGDEQSIVINDQQYTVNAGDALMFGVYEPHSVPVSSKDALWVVTCQV